MAKKENILIQGAFIQFDETITSYLESVPKQLQAPVLDPPGGRKAEIKPLPINPTGGI
jgi:hypothetical protein